MIGLGIGIANLRRSSTSDAIASALANRAGISWQPWKYSTTMFTDTAGTIAATIPGDVIAVQKCPVKIGAQFQQLTLANRPILVRHPKSGRRNELNATATLSTQIVTVTAAQRTLSFTGTGTVTLSGASTAGPLIGTDAVSRVSLTFTPTAGGLTLTVTGSVTAAQLELGAVVTGIQTVTSIYDVTEAGQRDCWGLYHDGVNDSMATAAALNLSANDKLSAFIGMQKLTDSGVRTALEFSANLNTNNGGALIAPGYSGGGSLVGAYWSGQAKGSVLVPVASPATFPAPRYGVNTLVSDISVDSTILRNNGIQVATSSGDLGTGNFGTHTLYKGARGGTTLFFSGIDWGGAIIGGLTTADAATIAAIEAQIAANTPGVTL